MKDPTTGYEHWAPAAPALLRNTFYGTNSLAYLNGHTYRASTGGTTGGSVPGGLTGDFPGTVTDGTVQWSTACRVWRGRGLDVNGKTDITLYGLTLDMSGPREDSTYPITTTIPGLMQGSYADVTTGSGWDSSHQALYGNANVGNMEVTRCWMKSCRGENAYLGGGATGQIRFMDCDFTDGNADGLSSTAELRVYNCRFSHISQASECFAGTFSQDFIGNYVRDCFNGIIVGASAAVTNPGRTSVVNNNVTAYSSGIHAIATGAVTFENIDICHNTLIDCRSWSIFVQGFATGAIANGIVADNKMIVDQQAATVGIEISSDGTMTDVLVHHNQQVRTPSAISGARDFGDGLRTGNIPAGSSVRYIDNTFRGRINTGGSVSATVYTGLFRGNIYGADASGDLEPINAAGTIHPHNERLYILSNLGANTTATAATIGNVTSMEDGQLVRLINFDETKRVLIPISGTTHAFPSARLTSDKVNFVVRLKDGLWFLEKYELTTGANKGLLPTANDVTPSYASINSFSPQIQMWGLLKTKLSNAGATNLNEIVNYWADQVFTVEHGANETFKHNAGAGVKKLSMAGAVDYVPGAPGEVQFIVPTNGTFAYEMSRRLY
jgi:hypothetical protein